MRMTPRSGYQDELRSRPHTGNEIALMSSSSKSDDLDGIYDTVEPSRPDVELVTLMREITGNLKPVKRKKHKKLLEPIVPFAISSSIALLPLHSSLMNEPYADRGRLPLCLFSTRPFFMFKADVAGTRQHPFLCYYLGQESEREQAMLSYVSVVDVYDFYGLEMAHSYLHHLYHSQMSLRNPYRLCIYIIGSLAVIRPDLAVQLNKSREKTGVSHLFALYLCSVLLSELVSLDSHEPKLPAPIEPHTTVLPVEILARIFNSTLISKSIAEHVTKQRIYQEMRPGEIWCRARSERVMFSIDMTTMISIYSIAGKSGQSWVLTGGENTGKLEQMKTSEVPGLHGAVPVLHSPRDTARLRHISVYDAFSHALELIDTEDVRQVCAWIVLLFDELEIVDKKEEKVDRMPIDLLLALKSKVLDKLRPAENQA